MRKGIVILLCILGFAYLIYDSNATTLSPRVKKASVTEGTSGCTGKAYIATTGQTVSYRANDDGALEEGVAWTSARFTDNGDSTISDSVTMLTWAKTPTDSGTTNDWNTAVDYCANLSLGGADDWRLGNVREIMSLWDFSRSSPPLVSGHPFSALGGWYIWSSTTRKAGTTTAWYFASDDGNFAAQAKTDNTGNMAWCVRGTTGD